MKIKSFEYKGLFLSQNSINDWIIINDIIYNTSARTSIYNNNLYHWWKSSKTLSDLRVFSIYWTISWIDSEARALSMQKLNSYIAYIWIWEEFFEFKFEDFLGNFYKSDVKVYSTVNYENKSWNKWEPIITFEFTLLSKTPEYIWYYINSEYTTYNSNVFLNGWVELWVELWDELGSYSWIQISNNWNFIAKTKIEINWNFTDLKIYNYTNNRFYWIYWTYNNIVIDNTWNNIVITSNWVDISSNRMPGSVSILLNPWINSIWLIANSSIDYLDFNIKYYHTWI